jgi:hypothetical protein
MLEEDLERSEDRLATATQKLAEASNAADESDRYDFKKNHFLVKNPENFRKFPKKITKNVCQNIPKKSKNH